MGNERIDNLKSYVMEYIETVSNRELQEQVLHVFAQHNEEILKDILWNFSELFTEAKKCNKTNVKYIVINFLNYGVQQGTISLKIDLCDDENILDEKMISKYYTFRWFDQIISEDKDRFLRFISDKMIRVRHEELCFYRHKSMTLFMVLFKQVLNAYLPYILALRSYMDMDKANGISVIYGEFMCEGVTLYHNSGEDIE